MSATSDVDPTAEPGVGLRVRLQRDSGDVVLRCRTHGAAYVIARGVDYDPDSLVTFLQKHRRCGR